MATFLDEYYAKGVAAYYNSIDYTYELSSGTEIGPTNWDKDNFQNAVNDAGLTVYDHATTYGGNDAIQSIWLVSGKFQESLAAGLSQEGF